MSLLQEERKCSTTRRFHSSFSNGRWIGGGRVVAVGFGFWLLFSFRFDTHYFLIQTLNLIKWTIIIIIYCVHYYLLLLLNKPMHFLFFSPNDNNILNSCWILIIFLKPDYWTLITKRGFDINYELQFYNRFLIEGDNVEHVKRNWGRSKTSDHRPANHWLWLMTFDQNHDYCCG